MLLQKTSRKSPKYPNEKSQVKSSETYKDCSLEISSLLSQIDYLVNVTVINLHFFLLFCYTFPFPNQICSINIFLVSLDYKCFDTIVAKYPDMTQKLLLRLVRF